MFCPKCRDEYVPGVEECVDCKVPLVESLPEETPPVPPAPPRNVDLVTVLETRDMGEMMVAKSLLESEGIRFISVGEGGMQHYMGQGTGMLSFLMNPMRLLVAAEDAEDAKSILSKE
jgi:hypothetical protein